MSPFGRMAREGVKLLIYQRPQERSRLFLNWRHGVRAYNASMIERNPNNVYIALAVLVAAAAAIAYFFGWRTMLRRERDLDDIYPPKQQ